jgi:hypothetical protein
VPGGDEAAAALHGGGRRDLPLLQSRTKSMATVSIATTARDLADNTWIWLVAHDGSWWLPATTMNLEGGDGGSRGSLSSSNLSC